MPAFPEASTLMWRDPGIVQQPFACGELPSPFPLELTAGLYFDATGSESAIPALAFDLESQRTLATWSGSGFGWLGLDLSGDPDVPSVAMRQAHVTGVTLFAGRYATSATGVRLKAVPAGVEPPPPPPPPDAAEIPVTGPFGALLLGLLLAGAGLAMARRVG